MWKHVWTKAFSSAVFVVVLLFGSQVQAACIEWSDAKSVIAKNNLLNPGEVRRGAMQRGGEVISINLCRKGGRYVYRLTVIRRKKRVLDMEIDARNGKRIGGRSSGARGASSNGKRLKKRIIKRVRRNLRRHGINY